MRLQSLSLITIALGLSACASLRTSPPDAVQEALAKAGLPAQSLAVVAFPLGARERGLRLQSEKPMQPGSTMKLVTAIVALDRLGPNSRGHTELLADAAPQGDVLAGPLYLRGGADSDLDWGALWALLRSLREKGVREIQGGVVVDRSLFRPGRLEIGVPPFDESPEFQYNVIPDALYINGQLLDLLLQSDAQRVQARFFPAWPGMRVDASALTLNDKACEDWEDGWQIPAVSQDAGGSLVQLRGSFPRNCKTEPALNLVDRQWLAIQAVRQLWRELGGVIGGKDREGSAPAGAQLLASHRGRPLAEVMRGMMKDSDNPQTRLLYLRLGAANAGPNEDTRAAAERTVRGWFAWHGIADQGLVLDNGSGLSRSERITASQMAALLLASHEGLHSPELLATLPVAGVDGTLGRRFKGSALEGRARLKTGTLRNAVALAGFVPDAHGRSWIVVTMLNDEQAAAKGRPVLDAVVEWVGRQ